MTKLASLQRHLEGTFPCLMGVRVKVAEPERIVAELEVRQDLCTSGFTLHGGAMMAFADTLGAIGTIVNLPAGKWTTTIDSNTKFLSSPSQGTTVTGISRPFHRGGTTMVWQTEIRSETDRLCAVVTQTQLVLEERR